MFDKLINKLSDRVASKLSSMNTVKEVQYDKFSCIEYDKEISDKMKNMMDIILKYSQNLNIIINDEEITISCDNIEDIKKGHSPSSRYNLIDEANNLIIKILKDRGFTIYMAYEYGTRQLFKDTEIYSYFLPIIEKNKKELGKKKFNDMFNNIMKKSKLIRDHNLNSILD